MTEICIVELKGVNLEHVGKFVEYYSFLVYALSIYVITLFQNNWVQTGSLLALYYNTYCVSVILIHQVFCLSDRHHCDGVYL